ncbi:MAG: acetoacetate decarboxylase family protein [Alphaproteobacteria bacterium]|nr:acetoacetate decarboxylase family protein [Alphaproteobacteria bacterium]
MLNGFTPPFTPSGRSALLPAPPWHYAGSVLSLSFPTDRSAAQSLLPDGFGQATGRAYGHFCDWQATTDGSELLDPAYAQYKEFFVLIEAERANGPGLYCPFIYVDQDISLVRGLLQGWPKKLGSIWMTRSYGLDHPAAAPLQKGSRFGGTLAVKDRRLAEAAITLSGQPGEKLGFLAIPTFALIAKPSLLDSPDSGPKTLAKAKIEGVTAGTFHAGKGTLRFLESPRDELALLAPLGEAEASLGTFAMTITGAIKA